MAGTPPAGSPPANPAPPAPAGQPPAAAPPAAQPPTPAPAPATPPAVPPAAPPAKPPAPPADKAKPPEPAWTAERTKSAEKAVLSRHGVPDEETLKAKLARLQELEDAQKTEQEKLQEKATRAEELEQQLATFAAGQMGALTAEQQAAVKAVAGNDAGRQLSAIEALRPTWGQSPAQGDGAAGPQAGQPSAAPPVNPATTTQTQPAPSGGSPPPPTNQYERYKAIRAQNPILAEDFRDKYAREIAEAEAAEAAKAATS